MCGTGSKDRRGAAGAGHLPSEGHFCSRSAPIHPLIIKPPPCYILVLYWGDLVLGGLGGFSIRELTHAT